MLAAAAAAGEAPQSEVIAADEMVEMVTEAETGTAALMTAVAVATVVSRGALGLVVDDLAHTCSGAVGPSHETLIRIDRSSPTCPLGRLCSLHLPMDTPIRFRTLLLPAHRPPMRLTPVGLNVVGALFLPIASCKHHHRSDRSSSSPPKDLRGPRCSLLLPLPPPHRQTQRNLLRLSQAPPALYL